jgi:hypothetical protein
LAAFGTCGEIDFHAWNPTSAISTDGRLFLQVRSHSSNADAVFGLLLVLLRKIACKLLIIWDESPIYRSKLVKAFLACGGAKRIHLEQLPGYAPDLNPDEGIWNKNSCKPGSDCVVIAPSFIVAFCILCISHSLAWVISVGMQREKGIDAKDPCLLQVHAP